MTLDLGHIHDILQDAKDDERYSPEARTSAQLLAIALGEVYENGYRQGQTDRGLEPRSSFDATRLIEEVCK